jgi:hypothetical protein
VFEKVSSEGVAEPRTTVHFYDLVFFELCVLEGFK